jgi:predicted anti-sigma-YlaC factor YlaD
MRCRETEKWILRSLDGILDPVRQKALDGHIECCPRCRRLREEYTSLLGRLKSPAEPAPLPRFWERLRSRIADRDRIEPWTVWAKWSLRAIPVSLVLIGCFIGAIAFLSPKLEEDMSQPEALLLQNADPLTGPQTLFNEEKVENRNMMIIFAGDERIPNRRYGP